MPIVFMTPFPFRETRMDAARDLRKGGDDSAEPICGFVIEHAVDLRRPPMALECRDDGSSGTSTSGASP
jgi:hypothetical protein